MILTEVKFFSETLTLGCAMYVLLPQRSLADAQKKPQKKFRTLYLLHGHSDDHTAWQRWTSIERFVEGLNLAVVMPAVVRNVFPLSSERKDNFVAGLSMGGYGAFKLALTHPERYAAAASLSGAVDIREVVKAHNDPANKA